MAPNKTRKLAPPLNIGVIYFAPKNMMSIKNDNTMSFINDCMAVKGIQSPKQPQVRILPDKTA